MLVVSSLRGSTGENDNEGEMVEINLDDFPDFSSGSCLLDSFDFDDIFAGMEEDESDELPDLDILGDYSISGTGDELEHSSDDGGVNRELDEEEHEDGNFDVASGSGSGLDLGSVCSQAEGVVDKVVEVDGKKSGKVKKSGASAGKAGRSRNKGCDGKRKVKVDWTPELHKRFVQAVEQLGEKAVPSRILEIMGTEGLTRHNIASHLQKYRSHRKHLIAREVEAASWSQRRHLYGGARTGGPGKRVGSPWLLPTMGFPQPMPPPPPPPVHHHPAVMRPLHVWGHPSADHTPTNMWPRHIVPHHLHPPALQPQPIWTPSPTYGPSQGMPCFPPPAQVQRFVAPPVPGIPHQALYKADPCIAAGQAVSLHPPPDSAPSSESIDAALEDVLAKPWLPLPIGLKPPAIDSVVVELQRKGVPSIPPS